MKVADMRLPIHRLIRATTLWPLLSTALFVSLIVMVQGAANAQPLELLTPARVIVKYRDEATPVQPLESVTSSGPAALNHQRLQGLGLRTGMSLRSGRQLSDRSHVVLADGLTSQQLAQQLARQPGVEYASVDRRVRIAAVPSDPFYATVAASGSAGGPVAGQWYMRAPSSKVNSSINAEQAWDISTGSPSIVVAVLDTGIRFDHPDFVRVSNGGNVLDGYDFVTGKSPTDAFYANDGDSRDADASDPGDWLSAGELAKCGELFAYDSSWHGTQVAGLIGAATNNHIGIASVGRNVKVLPVRVLGKCGGFDSDIIAGARWAAGLSVPGVPDNTNPARVLNLSLGEAGSCSQAYKDAVTEITRVGAVLVAAAGNSDGSPVDTPANCPGVIAVAAVNHNGTKAYYSDLGPEITLSAPGGNCVNDSGACLYPIMSTSNAGTTTPMPGGNYTDAFANSAIGTSFSAPLVAGTVGLMLSINPSLTPADIKNLLQRSARPFPTIRGTAGISQCSAPSNVSGLMQLECYCTTATCGAGMLDTGAAVQLASSGYLPQITTDSPPPEPGSAISLSAVNSVVPSGRTISAFAWALIDSGGIVSAFSAGTDTSLASITPSAGGRFTVQLTLTDDLSAQHSIVRSIEVSDASIPIPPASGGGGGGGALQPYSLLGLLLAAGVLRAHRRVANKRAPR